MEPECTIASRHVTSFPFKTPQLSYDSRRVVTEGKEKALAGTEIESILLRSENLRL